MPTRITVTFSSREVERLATVIVRAQNNGAAVDAANIAQLVRRATLSYVDFWEKMSAGDLDGDRATALVLRAVDGMEMVGQNGNGGDGHAPRA